MNGAAGSNGAKSPPEENAHQLTLKELEEKVAQWKHILDVAKAEGFTDDRPLVEQVEERIKELREQIAKEREHPTEPSVEPKKPEEEENE